MKNKNTIFAMTTNKVHRKDLAQLHQSNAKASKLKLYSKIDNAGSEMIISDVQLEILERFGCCFLITGTIVLAAEHEGLEGDVVYFLKKNVLKILIL